MFCAPAKTVRKTGNITGPEAIVKRAVIVAVSAGLSRSMLDFMIETTVNFVNAKTVGGKWSFVNC
jgi:hypothetical protein